MYAVEDNEIVELYFRRDERAITETSRKYEAYCMKISMNILNSRLDSEECVNDTYMQAWTAIPPHRPAVLASFLGKIARNLAINRYNALHAGKREAGEYALSLDELDDCVAGRSTVESEAEIKMLSQAISAFLREQPAFIRRVFVCRYFYCDSIAEIAALFKVSESKVKSVLFRTRNRLRKFLEEGGITI